MIYTYEPKKLFHFGVLFENPTWQLKVNGELKCARGTKPYLYLENNCGGAGVSFLLTDKKGKEERENGKKKPFIFSLTT